MGEGMNNISREDWASWLNNGCTKAFLEMIDNEKVTIMDAILNIDACGDNLTARFSRLKGAALAYEYVGRMADELMYKGENEDD